MRAASQQLVASDYPGALATLSDESLAAANDWRLYALRASIHKGQRSWERAIVDLTAALGSRESPDQAEKIGILRDRAFAYRSLGQWSESIADLTSALVFLPDSQTKMDPKSSTLREILLRDRAYAYCQVRDVELALADYDSLAADAPGALDRKSRDSLQAVVALKTDVPFFAITTVGRIDQNDTRVIPRAIQQLQPKVIDFINLRFWWYPITAPELRYTVPADKELAQRVVDVLRSNQFQVNGPIAFHDKTPRTRRIELWFPRPDR